ncbi:MAG: hypothetical protein JWM95_3318 [Gemmatimonadetes bacterium]|nr:hypothetical protein [Gemmatimonadota bacterium]
MSHRRVAPALAALFLFVFGLCPLANKLTDGEAVQWYRHAALFWLFVGGATLVALFVAAWLQPKRLARLWEAASQWAMRIPTPVFVGAAAIFACAASAVFAMICFGRQPHNADEVAQLFHAKILLSGRLSLPVDPNPEFFGMDTMIDVKRWYSHFPVGGPAFLAVGVALGAAWLLNPILLALSVVSVHSFARRAYGEPVARATAALLALSPFALFMSASFMNHVPVLWLTAVAMSQLARWVDAERPREANVSAALIGLATGVSFTVRPLDALVVAGVIGVMQLTQLRGSRTRLWSIGAELVAGLIPAAILFHANAETNGAPFRLGYEVLYGSAHQLGFHVDPYGTMHTPMRAVLFASKYLLQLNVLLFEWPLPAVGVIIAGLVALRRPSRWDHFLLALLIAQVVAYACYWHDGVFRGPRFLFTALPAIVILAARAPFVLADISRGAARLVAIYALPVCVLMAWLAWGMGDTVAGRVRMYRRASPILRIDADSVAGASHLRHALVFVNEGREARNLHYLWSLGLSRGDAARLMVSAPSCAVSIAIEAEEALRPARLEGRRDRVVRTALSVDPKAPEPETCARDVRQDDAGSASFAPFFPANTIDSSGHVGGNVVYVLDLGAHNEVLRSRFGDRTWYRFGPRQHASDSLPTMLPYDGIGR